MSSTCRSTAQNPEKAIIRYTEENYGRLVGPDNVIISTGAKQSLFNLLFSIIDPQDEVIILAPYWVSYPEMVKMVHGVPVIVTPEDGSFHPQMSEIEDAVSSYTKAIIVNTSTGQNWPITVKIVNFCESRYLPDPGRHLSQAGVRRQNRPVAFQFHRQDTRRRTRSC